MAIPLTPSNAGVGADPFVHMRLAIGAPERVLALRMALSRVIRPGAVVLDAGCGALGILAIAAARLGAERVIGVDLGSVELARALAEENGVAERVQFFQGDLHQVNLPVERFDVIVAMVFNNDVRLDLPQQRLVADLLERYGHADTVTIPNRVRYTVAGYAPNGPDRSGSSNRFEWDRGVIAAEGQAGMTFRAVREVLASTPKVPPAPTAGGFRARWPVWWKRALRPPFHPNVPRYFDRTRMTLLTKPRTFVEIEFRRGLEAVGYPRTTALEVIDKGRLDLVIWQQDLLFDELLIRSSESPSAVGSPRRVGQGDVAVIHTSMEDEGPLPLHVEQRAASTLGR